MEEAGTRNDDSAQPGAASRQDTPDAVRILMRNVMRVVPKVRRARQGVAERLRRLRGAPHVVHLFHQVDDAYSELAIQAAAELAARFEIEFRFHLVGQAEKLYAPEPDLLAAYARRDSASVAPHYGLSFPADADAPPVERVARVEALLTDLRADPRFLDVALEAGRALWRGDEAGWRSSRRASPPRAKPPGAPPSKRATRCGRAGATIPAECFSTGASGTGASTASTSSSGA
ncbi:MAG: hypothetical protein NXI30_18115 [bacterium]|nr:hypothetical protein [bacterium]